MRRRFLSLTLALSCACGVGVPTPSVCRAADSGQRIVRVGFVHPQSPSTASRGVAALWERLHELGYIEGQNLIIEARWADGQADRLAPLVADVLERKVDVLVTYGTQAAVAAKNATTTVAIVGVAMGEPLRTGLTTSLARPGHNLTGLSAGYAEGLGGKWLQLLREAVPRLSTVAVITNPDNPVGQAQAKEIEAIAPTMGLKLWPIEVRRLATLDHAFEQAGRNAQAVLVLPSVITTAHRWQVTALAAKHRLPTIYYLRDYVDAGGLMSYGSNFAVQWRRAADYVDKVLNGAKPGDLPIEQPTQYELIVNLKTAKALGITIPESILLRADEVIR